MSTNINQTIKRAVEALRNQLNLKATHAHELVAAYLGYKSKIALKSDSYSFYLLDSNDPESFEYTDSAFSIRNRMKSLKGLSPDDPNFACEVAKIIQENVIPECSFCHHYHHTVKPVVNESYGEEEQLWVCYYCVDDNEREIGHCRYCGDEFVYSQKILNSAGECPDHYGESYLSPQEQEDWGSYVENVTKDGF